MQNNIFQLERFGKLAKRNFYQDNKKNLNNIIAFVGFPVLFFLFNLFNGHTTFSADARLTVMVIIIVLAFIFAPFHFFSETNQPRKGFIDAMLPASLFEKYLLMQLTCLIVAPLMPLVFYGGIDWLLSAIAPNVFRGSALQQLFSSDEFKWDGYMALIVAQQFIFFFNLHFVRNKMVKTIATLFVMQIAIMTILFLVVRLFFWGYVNGTVDGNLEVNILNGKSLLIADGYDVLTVMTQILRILLHIVLPIGLVIGSYFRFKSIRY